MKTRWYYMRKIICKCWKWGQGMQNHSHCDHFNWLWIVKQIPWLHTQDIHFPQFFSTADKRGRMNEKRMENKNPINIFAEMPIFEAIQFWCDFEYSIFEQVFFCFSSPFFSEKLNKCEDGVSVNIFISQ